MQKIRLEQEAKEAELKRQQDELARERDLIQKQKEDAEKAERERLQKIENERLEAERIKQEEARIAAMAPDKEKLESFVNAIQELKIPECKTDEATDIFIYVALKLRACEQYLLNEIEKLS